MKDHEEELSALDYFFQPRSIALVGASGDPAKPGGRCLTALVRRRYPGNLYPINNRHRELLGLPCYPSLKDIPTEIDMVIVSVPAHQTLDVLREAAEKQARVAVIFTSGFSEVGSEGQRLQEELKKTAKELGIRLLGPNCVGIVDIPKSVMASFANIVDLEPVYPLTLGFITQSGAFGAMIYAQAVEEGVGFSSFVSVGNEADTEFADFLAYMVHRRADTEIIGGYLEGEKNGSKLRRAAMDALQRGKPILIMKVGRTRAGARAAASHTGSLAGEDRIYDSFFRQVGIIRIESLRELTSFVIIHRAHRLPQGKRVAVLSVSGGAGVMMADKLEEYGLDVPAVKDLTKQQLMSHLPPFGSANNPVDMTSALGADPEIMGRCLGILAEDPDFDIIVANAALTDATANIIARDIIDVYERVTKPIIVTSHVFHPTEKTDHAIAQMKEAGIPVLNDHLDAVRALSHLVWYTEKRRRYLTAQGLGRD